jgi:ribonuclease Z
MMKMEPPVIYLPAEAVEDVRRLLLVMQRLDRGRMVCTINGVKPGDEIALSRDHVVTVFATTHTIPSVGYVVWDRRNKLKEEFVGLPGDKIRDLRLSGVEVTREVRVPLLAYTGDTSPGGLDNNPVVYQAKILITEMSFVRPNHRREKIHKFGHMQRADRGGPFQHALSSAGSTPLRRKQAAAEPEAADEDMAVKGRQPPCMFEDCADNATPQRAAGFTPAVRPRRGVRSGWL